MKRTLLLGGFVFFILIPLVRADSVVDVQVGTANIQAAAVNDSAFRLSVSYDGPVHAVQSVFLATHPTTAPATTIKQDNRTGLKSAAGELLIDSTTGQWTLRDAHDKTIILPCPISEKIVNPQTNKPFIVMNIGCNSDKPFQAYGCGDTTDSLLNDHATPHLGNGHAVVPYYWSPEGYSVLAVDSDDNTPASWTASADLGRVSWTFAGNSADLYIMPAATLRDSAAAYAQLSGPPPVPPRWSFGYLQSRWGWKDKAYIDDAFHQFISRKLPVDAFIFDFEWYTTTPDYSVPPQGQAGFTDFSFNPNLFPDPANQIAAMKSAGVHSVFIRKPRLGNSDLLAMARAKNWILSPGKSKSLIDSRCFDFANPDVRAWYVDQTVPLLKQGVDGWWDDEGELTFTTYYWWNQAEADALAKVDPHARLWTICRAFAPGLQRFGAAAWTGDIRATWAEFAKTPTHLLNWSLAGEPYPACDIGGYVGGTTPQLLTRWMQAGVFFPIMRSHSERMDQPHFPWLYGDEAEANIRKALELRYRLIPYYYSLAHQAHETGVPIMRPLAMEFPDDSRCNNLSDEWLMGDSLLATPILDPGDKRRVYLTKNETWFRFNSNTSLKGGQNLDITAKPDEIPAYVRAGTILPLGPVIQHTNELPGGPLEVQIYPGKDATFTLIEDDGSTTAYLNGQLRRTIFSWNDAAKTLSWKIDGPYTGKDIFTDITVSVMDTDNIKHAAGSINSDNQIKSYAK